MWLCQINDGRRQPTKACNDNGDQCDPHKKCVTYYLRELHAPKKVLAWGRVWQCFELVAHVDDMMIFGNG